MNLNASAIVLRPRTLGEILDLACRLGMSIAFGVYLRLSLVVLLPVLAGGLALHYAAHVHWGIVWLLTVAAGTIAQGVFTVAIGRLLFAEQLSAVQVLGIFARRLPSYLAMLALSRGLLAAAALPGLVGVPFLWPRVAFVYEASLLEGAGPVEAIQRSSRFVTDRVIPVLGALAVLLLSQGVFVVIVELLCQGVVADALQLGKPFGSLFSDGGSPYALAGLLLSFPYVATARFLHYIDGRTRSDGWDIQLRFMAIALAERERKEAA